MTNTSEPRQCVLVAGPDPDDRELTARALTGLGYHVVARAPSGLEAIEAAGRQRPDLILVNVRLSGALDGPGAARAVAEIYGIPAVLVVEVGWGEFDRTPGSLPYVVLRKPFDLDAMKAAVETALRRPMPERDGGLEWSPAAGRDGLFAVVDPSGAVEYVSRDVDGSRDPDPDASGERGLVDATPWRFPPGSDAP
jgi:CheY-like chemotaxis protein